MLREFLKALGHTIRDEWAIQVLALLVLTILVYYGWKLFFRHLVHPQVKKTKGVWDTVLANSLYQPVSVFIWLVGITLAGQVVARLMLPDSTLLTIDISVRRFGIILLFTWFLLRIIKYGQKALIEDHPKRNEFDITTIHAIGKILYLVVLMLGFMIGLQTFGIGISGLLAFGSLGGAAVAFASKDLLANFFGGMIIYLDKPFVVGESVRSPDKNIEGEIEHIGWRLTCIRTPQKTPLYVPNSLFSTILVENTSRMTHRQVVAMIGVRYEDAAKMPALLQDIRTMLQHHEGIDHKQKLLVNFVELATSSLNIKLTFYTKVTKSDQYLAVQQDVLMQVLKIIEQQGAQCPFPTTTLCFDPTLLINHKDESHDIARTN